MALVLLAASAATASNADFTAASADSKPCAFDSSALGPMSTNAESALQACENKVGNTISRLEPSRSVETHASIVGTVATVSAADSGAVCAASETSAIVATLPASVGAAPPAAFALSSVTKLVASTLATAASPTGATVAASGSAMVLVSLEASAATASAADFTAASADSKPCAFDSSALGPMSTNAESALLACENKEGNTISRLEPSRSVETPVSIVGTVATVGAADFGAACAASEASAIVATLPASA